MARKDDSAALDLRLVDTRLAAADVARQAALGFTAEELATRADQLATRQRAHNTERAFKYHWEHFEKWCAAAPGSPSSLPATAETVRFYLAAHSQGPSMLKAVTLKMRMSAITRKHREAGFEPPTRTDAVREVVSGVELSQVDEGIVPVRKKAFTKEELESVVLGLPVEDKKIAVRNRAILLMTFAGGCRRAEIVGLNIADVEIVDKGMLVTIRKSKTDQKGKGLVKAIPYGTQEPGACPVLAYKAWLAELKAVGRKAGPVFYGMARHDIIGDKRLRGEAVAEIVKKGALFLGKDADDYAAHTLRATFVTLAYEGGAEREDIARQTGHKSAILEIYIRSHNLFSRNAFEKTGF